MVVLVCESPLTQYCFSVELSCKYQYSLKFQELLHFKVRYGNSHNTRLKNYENSNEEEVVWGNDGLMIGPPSLGSFSVAS